MILLIYFCLLITYSLMLRSISSLMKNIFNKILIKILAFMSFNNVIIFISKRNKIYAWEWSWNIYLKHIDFFLIFYKETLKLVKTISFTYSNRKQWNNVIVFELNFNCLHFNASYNCSCACTESYDSCRVWIKRKAYILFWGINC